MPVGLRGGRFRPGRYFRRAGVHGSELGRRQRLARFCRQHDHRRYHDCRRRLDRWVRGSRRRQRVLGRQRVFRLVRILGFFGLPDRR
ncbi:MAG: hypothetical protein JO206_09740 [Solirubrobacterales bacterium]|nr:hypothetical protein [Solirubrobacterales bacterium]